jgi:branched-chain amino acid transport system permease protein
MSLNLLIGYLGTLPICHAAFYGIGAYTNVLLMIKLNIDFILSLCLSIVFTSLLSLVISVLALRLKEDSFILATISFQIVVFELLYNMTELTSGASGISGIPRPILFGVSTTSLYSFCIFSGIITFICGLLVYWLIASPFGRVLRTIRDDESAALALGKNTGSFKITIFAFASGFAAIAGALWAGFVGYIDPTTFTVTESIFILSMVIIGGSGTFSGSVVGAIFMVIVPEFLRFIQIPDAIAANLKQIISGVLIILFMRFRPNGLLGKYKFN